MGDSDSNDYQFTFFDKLKWKVKDKSIEKILRDMQMHKSSLNSMIFIYSKSVVTYFDDFTSSSLFRDDLLQSLHLPITLQLLFPAVKQAEISASI